MKGVRLWLILSGALALRCILVLLDVHAQLSSRVEVANAFTRIAGIREGLELMKFGDSPYVGSAFHAPPLLLPMLKATSQDAMLSPLPFMAADVLSAVLMYLLARQLAVDQLGSGHRAGPISPESAAALLLWNPFIVLTSAGASTGSFTICTVLMMLLGAAHGSPALAAIGAALAAYLDPHSALLMLPVCMILNSGVEDLLQEPSPEEVAAAEEPCTRLHRPDPPRPTRPLRRMTRANGYRAVSEFVAWFLLTAMVLLMLSDLVLAPYKQHPCMAWLPNAAERLPPDGIARTNYSASSVELLASNLCKFLERASGCKFAGGYGPHRLGDDGFEDINAPQSWPIEAYSGIFLLDDLKPNIGVWWYFVIEMFQEYKAFFIFVLHVHVCIFTVPLAVRLHHRPFFVCLMQLMFNALLKPYPTIADIAMVFVILPFCSKQLARMQGSIFLVFLTCLLSVVGPITYNLWIHAGSANANFFYAVTLLWAGTQVMAMLMMLTAIQEYDRILAGKPLVYTSHERAQGRLSLYEKLFSAKHKED